MKEKVNVTGVPETMIQTLYARAKETKKENAKIKDEIAVELVEKLDYDFSKADKDSAMTYGVIARTIVLDRMVRQYLENHENTVVVNIACGLDTRCYRMKGKYLRWYNVDLPETMKIRRQFLPETGPIYQIANRNQHSVFLIVAVNSNVPVNQVDIKHINICKIHQQFTELVLSLFRNIGMKKLQHSRFDYSIHIRVFGKLIILTNQPSFNHRLFFY